MEEKPRKLIRATREITVNINGEEYDALLIPKEGVVEIDFSRFPEDDPMRRSVNVKTMSTVDLEVGVDLTEAGGHYYRLTEQGAKRLLESL